MEAGIAQNPARKRLVVGISGASGVILGIRLLEYLRSTDLETHLVISPAAHATIAQETDWKVQDVLSLATVSYRFTNISAAIASGSFATQGMVVLPCSIKPSRQLPTATLRIYYQELRMSVLKEAGLWFWSYVRHRCILDT